MGNSTKVEEFALYPREILKERVDAIIEEDAREHGTDYYSGYWGPKMDGLNFISGEVTSYEGGEISVCSMSNSATDQLAVVKIKYSATDRNNPLFSES